MYLAVSGQYTGRQCTGQWLHWKSVRTNGRGRADLQRCTRATAPQQLHQCVIGAMSRANLTAAILSVVPTARANASSAIPLVQIVLDSRCRSLGTRQITQPATQTARYWPPCRRRCAQIRCPRALATRACQVRIDSVGGRRRA